jgi:tetratricopeptide (TPR) repeat protein
MVGLAFPAAACINTFDSNIRMRLAAGDAAEAAAIAARLESDYRKEGSLARGNDLAVAKLLLGQYEDAIELLQQIEQRFPGYAVVAANLGTAYELSGHDEEALIWIREGVRRDPNEHRGSEWLHVLILEAKLALARDPAWLQSNTVLGLDFGNDLEPRSPGAMPLNEAGAPRSKLDVMNSIHYQLSERTKFVRAPNAIIADLYAAAGDLAFEGSKHRGAGWWLEFSRAESNYQKARVYGPARAALVDARLLFVKEQTDAAPPTSN